MKQSKNKRKEERERVTVMQQINLFDFYVYTGSKHK